VRIHVGRSVPYSRKEKKGRVPGRSSSPAKKKRWVRGGGGGCEPGEENERARVERRRTFYMGDAWDGVLDINGPCHCMVYRADPAQAYRVSGRAERTHFLLFFFPPSGVSYSKQTSITPIYELPTRSSLNVQACHINNPANTMTSSGGPHYLN
jgi:hypothetical protein